MAAETLLG